ncbi:MAG: TAXI family TRAP transporter solute-binding subunit [Hyphomicrobiales bacterium]
MFKKPSTDNSFRKAFLASALAASVFGAATSSTTQAAEQQFVSIGTAGVTGIYYAAGGAICWFVNRDRKEHGIRCSTESTGGSVYNLRNIRDGELDLGVFQSDWQFHAVGGTSVFEKDGKDEKLRAVFSLHPDTVAVVARKNANVMKMDGLKGKRINLGNAGSGTRATADAWLDAVGWTNDDFALVTDFKSAEQSKALCDGNIDAFYMVAGNPVGNIMEAATTCEITMVPMTGEKIDALVDSKPYYRHATIPGGLYRGVDDDVKTYGVAATFVTSSDVSEDVIYQVVKAVFENFDAFRKLHPAFTNLNKEDMVNQALSAPIHPGALRYYKEAGLK